MREKTCQKSASSSLEQSKKYVKETEKAFEECMAGKKIELDQANADLIFAINDIIQSKGKCTKSNNDKACEQVSIFMYLIVFRLF